MFNEHEVENRTRKVNRILSVIDSLRPDLQETLIWAIINGWANENTWTQLARLAGTNMPNRGSRRAITLILCAREALVMPVAP